MLQKYRGKMMRAQSGTVVVQIDLRSILVSSNWKPSNAISA